LFLEREVSVGTHRREGHRWAVVLAAGEGSRLRCLTGAPGRSPVPKQYCSLTGGPSLLRLALERARRTVPADRVLVVVARQHRRWFASELADLAAGNVLVQPANRGTAAGVLLPLLTIERRDPRAEVVLLASDHCVEAEWTLQAAIEGGLRSLASSRAAAILLGMTAECPDADLGWILPMEGQGHVRGVRCFREKPPPAEARALHQGGALVNSFLLVGRVARLLRLYDALQPTLTASMRTMGAAGGYDPPTYRRLPLLDFSRDLLERAADALAVLAVPPCGWSDLGTPERVARCLAERPAPAALDRTLPVGARGRTAPRPVLAHRLGRAEGAARAPSPPADLPQPRSSAASGAPSSTAASRTS
jgi:mannose-1-phosphate guanylyltransferase